MQNPLNNDLSLYKQLFNLSNVIKLIMDAATLQIVEANPAACQFYGYSLAQLTSMTIRDININALPEDQRQAMSRSIAAGTENTFQTQHRTASGEIREVSVQIGHITQSDKSYFYSVIQDKA